jgi:hypothetical protein
MRYIHCFCGEILNVENIGERASFSFFSEEDWEHITLRLISLLNQSGNEAANILRENVSDALADYAHELYKCPNCGRLFVYWQNNVGVSAYVQESHE